MPIDKRLNGGQAAAVVPAAGVRPCCNSSNEDRDDQNQTRREFLPFRVSVDQLAHRFFLDTLTRRTLVPFRWRIPYNRLSLTGRCGCGIIISTNQGKHGTPRLLLILQVEY
jgi:hypothetical protein